MEITFLHKGPPENAGADSGATYQVGEHTVWLDPVGAAYLTVNGISVQSDFIGQKVRVFGDKDDDRITDIPWGAVPLGESPKARATAVLTALLVHTLLLDHVAGARQPAAKAAAIRSGWIKWFSRASDDAVLRLHERLSALRDEGDIDLPMP